MRHFFILRSYFPIGWVNLFEANDLVEFSRQIHNYEEGILVPENKIKIVLDKLKMQVEMQKIIAPNINHLILTPKLSNDIFIGSWNGKGVEKFIELARKYLLPIINKSITFYVPHGAKSNIYEDGNFHIQIYTSPIQEIENYPPRKIFGIPIPCRDSSLTPREKKGRLLIDEATNYIVAEINSNDFYIYHDICHSGENVEIDLFELLLKKYLSH
jgi:hypothetical protein